MTGRENQGGVGPMAGRLGLGLSVSLFVAAGCNIARLPDGARYACASTPPFCEPGFACVAGQCVDADAGTSDAGSVDGGAKNPRFNVVFLSREQFSGSLGGVAGADQRCQNDAQDAGLEPNTYRAWLLPGGLAPLPGVSGGLVRPDGQAVAPNGEQFESHFLWNVPVLDSTGARATSGRFDFWYGGASGGGNCNGWSSDAVDGGQYRRADYDSPGAHRTWTSTCAEAHRLLCVGTRGTEVASQPPPPDGGTLIWLGAAVNGKLAYAAPCGLTPDGGVRRPFVTANVPAVYWTQVATAGPTYLDVGPVYRPDGVVVAENAHALGANNIVNPVTPGQSESRKNWPHWVVGGAVVWTGALTPESGALGANQPCRLVPTDSAWTTDVHGEIAAIGSWDRIGVPLDGWFFTAGDFCDAMHRVYCLRVNGR